MPGQPLVDERVVRPQQVEHVVVFRHDAPEQQLGLALEGLPEVVVEVREHAGVGNLRGKVPQIQPLPGEVGDERLRTGIGQQTPDLPLEHRRILQFPGDGQAEQLVVRDAAPEEERQPGRQLHVADPIGGIRRNALRIALDAEQEFRARKNGPERHLDAGVESSIGPSFGASLPVEVEGNLDVRAADRPPVRAAGQCRDDRLRAARFL